jgi:hypothetical protein
MNAFVRPVAADPIRVNGTELFAHRTHDLGTRDRGLQRFDTLAVGRVLQEHYHKVSRVALRLSGKRVALDHCSPLPPTAHKEVRFEAQPFLGLHFGAITGGS